MLSVQNNHFIFTYLVDNLCKNALDLSKQKLIVHNNLPSGTHCHWLISAEDKNFFSHPGVDAKGVIRAVYNNIFNIILI